ncbi:hypothetical protein [Delftia sp. K82]|uniref:hypothetical protein n=1 Tax=Delftia sp. K82 TaxID=1472718 RepID=UPI001177F0F8|nr:hypothetical protein [Delftia sp. K82]
MKLFFIKYRDAIIWISTACFVCASSAQGLDAPSIKEQTKRIIEAVSHYGTAIGCMDVAPTSKEIAAMIPYQSMENRLDAKFAVIWSGDIGCNGGSGSSGAHIAIVRVGSGDTFYVSASESEPQIDSPLPRSVERLVGATKNSLILDTRDYGEKDANCCPTERQRITIRQSEKGSWKKVEMKQLAPAKY